MPRISQFQLLKPIQFTLITNWLNDFGAKLTIDPELPVVIDRPRSLCVQIT